MEAAGTVGVPPSQTEAGQGGNPKEPPPLPTMATRPSAAMHASASPRIQVDKQLLSMMPLPGVLQEPQHGGSQKSACDRGNDVADIESPAQEVVCERPAHRQC